LLRRVAGAALAAVLAGFGAIGALLGAGLSLVGLCCGGPALAAAGAAGGGAAAAGVPAAAWLLLAAGAALLAAAFLVYRRLARPRAGPARGCCQPSRSRAPGPSREPAEHRQGRRTLHRGSSPEAGSPGGEAEVAGVHAAPQAGPGGPAQ
jgi:hypothetical protein